MNQNDSTAKTTQHGHNVKRIRELLGIKQSMLANQLGITQQAVSDMEKRTFISDETLEKVSGVLKISVTTIKNFSDDLIVDVILKREDVNTQTSVHESFKRVP